VADSHSGFHWAIGPEPTGAAIVEHDENIRVPGLFHAFLPSVRQSVGVGFIFVNPDLKHLPPADFDFFELGLQITAKHCHRLLLFLVLDSVLASAGDH